MARCYYLEYISRGLFSSANDKWICKLCRKEFPVDDLQVKYVCNAERGEEYRNCPVYRDRR